VAPAFGRGLGARFRDPSSSSSTTTKDERKERDVPMSDVAAGDPNTDYALSVVTHEAVRPRLEEVMAAHRADGSLDPAAVGGELRPLVEEMLDLTSEEDWQIAALCLIEEDGGASMDVPPSIGTRGGRAA
jgi:hypothetical protein